MDEKVLIVGANGHLGHVVVETDPINKQVLSAPSKLGASCGVKVSIG